MKEDSFCKWGWNFLKYWVIVDEKEADFREWSLGKKGGDGPKSLWQGDGQPLNGEVRGKEEQVPLN